jgi:hypothetical protein
MQIKIDKQPTEEKLKEFGVFEWGIWEKEVSSFPWSYDEDETCYILEGKATITPDDDQIEPVTIEKGDLVVFPKGMDCTWEITEPIKKHYKFG